jgi:hypothetical protein
MTDAQWMAEHKGPLLRTIAEVWSCGDDYCGCTQAQIVELYDNLKAPGWVVRVPIWLGTFRTDHEPGATAELEARRNALAFSDPEWHEQIEWAC